MNILSFDLEDWYQLIHRRLTGELIPAREAVLHQTGRLLEVLEKHQSKATFFVLGMVAERYPQLIRRICDLGHEIASHGYSHVRVNRLSPEQFEKDLRRSRDLLQDLTGHPIRGFRAPEFSISSHTLWSLDVIAKLGFTYDSSVFPIRHRRYGIPGFRPVPARYTLPSGRQIVELPLATYHLARARAPVAGGGYFRLLPLWFLRKALRRHEAERLPMVTYFHPCEFDPNPLDALQTVFASGWKRRLAAGRINWSTNLGRTTVIGKISALLRNHAFTSCQEYLNAARFPQNRTLFPTTSASV